MSIIAENIVENYPLNFYRLFYNDIVHCNDKTVVCPCCLVYVTRVFFLCLYLKVQSLMNIILLFPLTTFLFSFLH